MFSLVVFIVDLTDDHSVRPFVWGFVYGLKILFDVSILIIFVINDLILISGDLHDYGIGGLHSQHSFSCLVESLHISTAKHLCKVVNFLCLPEFVDKFQFLRLVLLLSSAALAQDLLLLHLSAKLLLLDHH